MNCLTRIFLGFLWFAGISGAQDESAIAVTDAETLAIRDREEVVVEGRVSSTRINTAGIHFLEFADTPLVCVTFAQNLASFPDGPPSEVYRDQWVRVRGKLEKFRGSPQIKLLSPDQIEILEAPKMAVAPDPEPATTAGAAPAAEKPDPATAPPPATADGLEIVDGVPALDWRKYFPPARP